MKNVTTIIVTVAIALLSMSQLFADNSHLPKRFQILEDVKFDLNYLRKELASYPTSPCIVRDDQNHVFRLSHYHRSGPLFHGAAKISQFNDDAMTDLGLAIEHICTATKLNSGLTH